MSALPALEGRLTMNTQEIIRLEQAAMRYHERAMRSGNAQVAKRAAKLWAVARARVDEAEAAHETRATYQDSAA